MPEVPANLEAPRRFVGVAAVKHLVVSFDFEGRVSTSDRVGVPQLIPLIRYSLAARTCAGAVLDHLLDLTLALEADLQLPFVVTTASLGCRRDQCSQTSAERKHD